MDKTKTHRKIKSIAQEFVRNLKKQKIAVEKVVLFGSYAQGLEEKDSDLDIVIISPDFKKLDSWERINLLSQARTNYEFPLDYFGLTPDEYNRASPLSILGEIKETGIEIYP